MYEKLKNARILDDSCPKNYKNTGIFYDICPKKITKFRNFRAYMIFARKCPNFT